MSRPRVRSLEGVPRARAQRTPPAAPPIIEAPAIVESARSGRYLPGQLGRFPTIGIDPGAIKGTVPGERLR